MPFETTANVPPANPKVTVVFSGLLVFRSGAENTCEVGVHRFSNNHVTQLLLMVNKPNKPPLPIPLLRGPLTSDFSISLQTGINPVPPDFTVFAASADPFDRFNPANSELDYRWAVNFRDPDIHPNININVGAQPMVRLTTGVLFTPHLTRNGLGPRLKRESGTVRLNRIAANMAVAINPAAGTNVLLSWSDLGDPLTRTLPRPIDAGEPNTTYTLFVINEPPGLSGEFHDEMGLYYKVLEDKDTQVAINGDDQFKFDCESIPGSKTDEVPCLEGRLDP